MPPITSSRPGARATYSGAPSVKNRIVRARAIAGANSSASADPRSSSSVRTRIGQSADSSPRRRDVAPQRVARVADPRDVALQVERRIQRRAGRSRDRQTELLGDEDRAEVVRMTTQRMRESAIEQQLPQQRTQIGDVPVVADHQLVELAP